MGRSQIVEKPHFGNVLGMVGSSFAESLQMRNLVWLALLLGVIGASACWLSGATPAPHPQETSMPAQGQEGIRFTWQEWGKVLIFVVQADDRQVRAYLEGKEHSRGADPEEISQFGSPWSVQLCRSLRGEIEAAVEEPCKGKKTRELTLMEGSRSWNVAIGAHPGPAQTRIIDLIEKSEISRFRSQLPSIGPLSEV